MKGIIKNIKNLISKMDKTLLFLTLFLFVVGLLNIVNASSREAVVRYDLSTYHYFFKQLEMLIVGLILSYILINLKTKLYKNVILIAYIIVTILSLALFKWGIKVNGAINWLPLPGIGTIQPSELAKPVMIVFISILFEQNYTLLKSDNPRRYQKIIYTLIVALLIPALTFLQKDAGSALIMVSVFGVMFLFSPIRRIDKLRTIVIVIIAFILCCAVLIIKQGYILSNAQLARFSYYNPCSKYETTGYQVCNSFIAINDGGLLGLGLGKSKQKYSYIPEPHTDSIFAIIAEENGAVKCTFIFIFYIIIIFRILKISMYATSIRGRYICLGIASYIFMHIFINLGGMFGIIPLTGVPLPFLSYGGSYAISLMCSLAVVQRIHIEKQTEKIKIKKIH